MTDRRAVDVNAGYVGRNTGEQPAAVPLAASAIEDSLTNHRVEDSAVAVPVLVPDRTRELGRETFTGKGK